ncbi:MAG TPA: AAA family ATPase, partial [Anaerolineales bacterium]|nr:AAA family ATPase [Anaerolineales bacterium]
MSKLELKLMGAFSASIDGAPATSFESNKVRALLAYLAVESHRQHPREALAALLWPDWPDSAARSNLRYALADLRKVIGDRQAEPPFLLISRESLQFNPESDCWLDVGEIEAMATDMRQGERVDIKRLEQAVALCQGEFLEGFSVADAAPFENWARLKREQLHRAYLHGLHQLAAALERSGEYERALVYARRHVIVEALDERAHRQVMRLLSFSGRDSEALAQYKTCQEVLDKELRAAPSAETSRLYELIRSGQLEAAAPAIPIVDGSQLPPDLAMKEVEKPVFVAREAELERLGAFLRNAVEGKGRVAFITGEAGSGKTALLQEFTRRSLAAHHQLLCSWGSCTACFGTGDPYQPFREIINILSGNYRLLASIFSVSQVHVQRLWNALPVVLQTLVARGPHLLPVLIDRNNLISNISHLDPGETNWLSELWKLLERVPNKPNGIERSQLYEQYTNTLLDLSNSYPLLLIIDDLQWADVSSLELLFHLARRLHHSRIMIVCAYRPEEIANARDGGINPLKKILAEFKAQLGDIWVDLNNIGKSERREFLDRFVDAEQNNLGSLFRQKLFERTRGHPLYTIEILRSMQDQGQLRKDTEGFWIEGENLIWEFIPIRVEGVIEERISHLDANLQEILSVASVQGLQFSTQVIAGVLEISEEHLSRRLGQELANRYRLVVEQEGFRLNGSFLTQFKFAHPLIQQYLYDRLGQQERIALHRRIAQMLEELYEGQLEVVAYQLVLHYAGE